MVCCEACLWENQHEIDIGIERRKTTTLPLTLCLSVINDSHGPHYRQPPPLKQLGIDRLNVKVGTYLQIDGAVRGYSVPLLRQHGCKQRTLPPFFRAGETQRKNTTLAKRLEIASEKFWISMVGLEAEEREHSATHEAHEATRAQLCDKSKEARAAWAQTRQLRKTVRAANVSNASLATDLAARAGEVDAVMASLAREEGKRAATTAALEGMQAEVTAARERLAMCATERRDGEDRLAAIAAELEKEKAETSDLAKELHVAREGLAERDAVIERQRQKISDGVLMGQCCAGAEMAAAGVED